MISLGDVWPDKFLHRSRQDQGTTCHPGALGHWKQLVACVFCNTGLAAGQAVRYT